MAKKDDQMILGIPLKKLQRHSATISRLRQVLDDASTAHASAWNDAEEDGTHGPALKLLLRLQGMDISKARDFLRAFDSYRGALGFNDQLDMFEQQEAEGANESSVQAAEDDNAKTNGSKRKRTKPKLGLVPTAPAPAPA